MDFMNSTDAYYYTLQLNYACGKHKAGEIIANGQNLLQIGQTENCDIILPNDSLYEDVVIAAIKPNANISGWRLIKASPYYNVYVNKMPIGLVHYLNDGDRITIDGFEQELLFHVRHDGCYDSSSGIQWRVDNGASWRRRIIAVVLLCMLISGLCLFSMLENRREATIIERMYTEAQESVFKIRVDSIAWLCVTPRDTIVVDTYSLSGNVASKIIGTAFLTADSLLVTARHCVEPWLNDRNVLSSVISEDYHFKPVYWALVSETYNQCHDNDTLYLLSSICTVWKGNKGEEFMCRLASTDFRFNKEYDEIVELGDFDSVYYWRSIARRGLRHDMMKADIAYVKLPYEGQIEMATRSQMCNLLSRGKRLDFIGYPMYAEVKKEHTHGELKHSYYGESDDESAYSEMLEHSGELLQGYSGAPVIVCDKDDWYVVGVVSVIDALGGHKIYSVPITEVAQ